MITTVPAISGPKSLPASSLRKNSVPSGGVARSPVWMTISGQKKSFQCETIGDHAEGQHGRHRERQHDAPQDLELAQAVDPGGVHQVVGHGLEELAHQEDAEGREDEGQDEGGIAVEQADLVEHDVARDGRHLGRDHAGPISTMVNRLSRPLKRSLASA